MALLQFCTKPSKYVCTFTISWRVDGVLFKSIPRWRKWIIHYALPLKWLLMTWPHNEAGNCWAWYWPSIIFVRGENHLVSCCNIFCKTQVFIHFVYLIYDYVLPYHLRELQPNNLTRKNSKSKLPAFCISDWLIELSLAYQKTLCFDTLLYRLTNLFLRKSIIPLEGKICPQDVFRLHVKFLWKSSPHLRFRISVYTMPGHDLPTNSLRYYLALLCNHTNSYTVFTLIARFIRSTWGPSGADKTNAGPCWPHKLCYLGTS